MGITACIATITITDGDVEVFDIDGILTPKIEKIDSLCPENLSISALENNTIVIYWEHIINTLYTIEDERLTAFENDLSDAFPNSWINIYVISNIVDLVCFVYIDGGKLLKRKGTVNGSIIEDIGLLNIERQVAERKNKIYAERINKNYLNGIKERLPDKSEEDQYRILLSFFSSKFPTSEFDYLNGSLDDFLCEHFFTGRTKTGYLDYIEEYYFATYPIKEIDFKVESLKPYIEKALYSLLKNDKVGKVASE